MILLSRPLHSFVLLIVLSLQAIGQEDGIDTRSLLKLNLAIGTGRAMSSATSMC